MPAPLGWSSDSTRIRHGRRVTLRRLSGRLAVFGRLATAVPRVWGPAGHDMSVVAASAPPGRGRVVVVYGGQRHRAGSGSGGRDGRGRCMRQAGTWGGSAAGGWGRGTAGGGVGVGRSGGCWPRVRVRGRWGGCVMGCGPCIGFIAVVLGGAWVPNVTCCERPVVIQVDLWSSAR